MDILCGCISYQRRFPYFLGRLHVFARPLHNTTQHKSNANYKKGRGAPQNRHHLQRKEYFSNADLHIFLLDPKALNFNKCIFQIRMF